VKVIGWRSPKRGGGRCPILINYMNCFILHLITQRKVLANVFFVGVVYIVSGLSGSGGGVNSLW
jgi:hypothetical protein